MKTLLNARVSEEVKDSIERQALEEEISVSLCTDNILKEYFGLFDDQENENIPRYRVVIDISIPFHKTPDYILLITWLFTKHMYTGYADPNQFISRIKSMIEIAMADSKFSNDLRFEFLKVLNDVNRYLFEPDSPSKQFHFCFSGNLVSFNYSLLINEVWKLSQ
jgi:hypothetical protein